MLPKGKKKPRGKAFAPGNPWRFPKGTSPNPGGRPKLMSESVASLLSQVDLASKMTFAELAAVRLLELAMNGQGWAMIELRRATEGDAIVLEKPLMIEVDR